MAVTKKKSKAQPTQQKPKASSNNTSNNKPVAKVWPVCHLGSCQSKLDRTTIHQKKDLKKSKRAFVPVPKDNVEQEEEELISEDDLEYFEQNKDFGRFLKALDPKELSRYILYSSRKLMH